MGAIQLSKYSGVLNRNTTQSLIHSLNLDNYAHCLKPRMSKTKCGVTRCPPNSSIILVSLDYTTQLLRVMYINIMTAGLFLKNLTSVVVKLHVLFPIYFIDGCKYWWSRQQNYMKLVHSVCLHPLTVLWEGK